MGNFLLHKKLGQRNFIKTPVLALRASILRKFALALSHSDLYKWFCRINRFVDPKVPGKTHLGDIENALPVNIINQIETQLFRSAADELSEVLYEPVDFSQCYMDIRCYQQSC